MIASAKINGLELIATGNYAVDAITGLESPERRVISYNKPGEDGGNISADYYAMRPVTFQGFVKSQGQYLVHEANRRALEVACAITRDAYGAPQPALIEITTMTGYQVFFYAEVQKFSNPIARGSSSQFMISLIAPDHRLYLPGLKTSGLVSRPAGGGFLSPFLSPFLSGASTGGSAQITHAGTVRSDPIIYFRDQLVTPYLVNSTTGQALSLATTVTGGTVVVVDTGEKTVMQGLQSLLAVKNETKWLTVEPGNNTFGFSTGNTGDTGTVEITWYDAVLGL